MGRGGKKTSLQSKPFCMSVGKHVGTNGNRNVVSRSAGGCKKQFYQMGPPSRTPTISSTPPNVPGAALTRWAARRRLGCRHGTIGGSSCESLHTNLEHFLILDVMLSKNCCTLVFGWSTRVARIDSDCCTPQKPTSSNPSRLEVKNPLPGDSDCSKWAFDPGATRIARSGFLQKLTLKLIQNK